MRFINDAIECEIAIVIGEAQNFAIRRHHLQAMAERRCAAYKMRLQSDVGRRLSAHATGLGKALLADLPDMEVRRLFGRKSLPRMTANTIVTVADLLAELRVIRETGCMVVVRPDQYVAHVLPLHGYDGLADFFAGVLIDAE